MRKLPEAGGGPGAWQFFEMDMRRDAISFILTHNLRNVTVVFYFIFQA